jgi:hypothetical protein
MQQLFIRFINYTYMVAATCFSLHCHAQGAFLVPAEIVDGRVVSNEVTSLDTTRPSTIFYRLLLN